MTEVLQPELGISTLSSKHSQDMDTTAVSTHIILILNTLYTCQLDLMSFIVKLIMIL